MKKLLFLILLFSSCVLRAHEFYFAFAEIQYNEESQTFQGTLKFTAHDLEDVLLDQNKLSKGISYIEDRQHVRQVLANYLFTDFKFQYNNQNLSLKILEFEIQKNGLIFIYIESEPILLEKKSLSITFCNLMDIFKLQQNKITFVAPEQKVTEVFLQDNCIKEITW